MLSYHTHESFLLLSRAARLSRHSTRNQLLLLLAYRHGLRVSELIGIQLSDINIQEGTLYVKRLKRGVSTTHPLHPDEVLLINQYLSLRPQSPHTHLFLSERAAPLSRFGINHLLKVLGKKTDIYTHPHMLRHSTGYYLANKGIDLRLIQEYMGHSQIQSTIRYTSVNHARFKSLFSEA